MIPNKRCCVLFYFLYFMSDFRFLKYTWNEFFQLSSTVWFSITSVNWPDCEFDACWSFSIFLADRTVKMKSSNFYLKKLFSWEFEMWLFCQHLTEHVQSEGTFWLDEFKALHQRRLFFLFFTTIHLSAANLQIMFSHLKHMIVIMRQLHGG